MATHEAQGDVTTIFTIGHSTRSLEEFLSLMHAHGVTRLVDVRRYPGSRRYPHFGSDALAESLKQSGIGYVHEIEFGGRRKSAADSPNTYWKNQQFRAYADHLASPEFQDKISRLIDAARQDTLCLMCAEAVPWRCHRQLMADVLVSRGISVRHILSPTRADEHKLNEAARLQPDGTLMYPAAVAEQRELFAD